MTIMSGYGRSRHMAWATPQFELDALVQYWQPLQAAWSVPHRVIGRCVTELAHRGVQLTYTLQVAELTGDWATDRPIAGIWEHDLAQCADLAQSSVSEAERPA